MKHIAKLLEGLDGNTRAIFANCIGYSLQQTRWHCSLARQAREQHRPGWRANCLRTARYHAAEIRDTLRSLRDSQAHKQAMRALYSNLGL